MGRSHKVDDGTDVAHHGKKADIALCNSCFLHQAAVPLASEYSGSKFHATQPDSKYFELLKITTSNCKSL
ncbi:MAG: hypothetical protein RMX65_010435 [Nostoc sp. DedQUE01]